MWQSAQTASMRVYPKEKLVKVSIANDKNWQKKCSDAYKRRKAKYSPLQSRYNYRNRLSCSIWCGSSFPALGNAEASWIYSKRLYHERRAASQVLHTTNAGLSTVILFFVYPNTWIFYWNVCKNLVISLFSMISASVKMCLVLVVVLCGHIVSVCK